MGKATADKVPYGFMAAALIIASTISAAQAALTKRPLPYFASIGAGRARMRTGPARTYPASWLYQRADLPVKVVATYKEWRKIEDPDGTEGWMEDRLLRDTRTAIVRAAQPAEMREQPNNGARLLWRAAPGVVGRIGRCGQGWCRFDVKGQVGFIEAGALWGIDPDEALP